MPEVLACSFWKVFRWGSCPSHSMHERYNCKQGDIRSYPESSEMLRVEYVLLRATALWPQAGIFLNEIIVVKYEIFAYSLYLGGSLFPKILVSF